MLARERMMPDPVAVTREIPMHEALRLMRGRQIRRLLVDALKPLGVEVVDLREA